ncbi:MAG: hypothetical protein ACK4GT_07605 [Pararhodobacter sp.]
MRSDLTLPTLRPLLAGLATALVLVLAAPVPAQAQTPGAEDLRALIYYLDTDDQRAVQAELRRLRAAYPRWTPPTDVNELRTAGQSAAASVDVAPIWARIERQDYTGARSMIADARARVPGWSPDAEMLRVLETNESQAAFDEAYARRDVSGAVAAVRRVPALMRCDRINNAWRMAELYQGAGQGPNAVTTYRGVISSCSRADEVLPTLEKANDVASLSEMTELFTVARQNAPANRERLDQLEARLRAGRGAAVAPAAASPAAPTATAAAPVAAAPAAAPAPVASAPMPATPVAPASLPLRGDGRVAQTRSLKEQGNWAGCLSASANPRSIEILYERAWCAYNLERAGEALAGFTAAAQSGSGLGGNVSRDARFGMILSYLNMNMTEEGARLAASTGLTNEQRVEVEGTILDQRGVRSFLQRDYPQAIAYLTALEQLRGTLRRDLAMLRAYAYLNNDQPRLAMDEFTRLNAELSTQETRDGVEAARGALTNG